MEIHGFPESDRHSWWENPYVIHMFHRFSLGNCQGSGLAHEPRPGHQATLLQQVATGLSGQQEQIAPAQVALLEVKVDPRHAMDGDEYR